MSLLLALVLIVAGAGAVQTAISGKDFKDSSLTSRDISGLKAKDFAPSARQLLTQPVQAGQTGPAGAPGAAGPAGDQGPEGPSGP